MTNTEFKNKANSINNNANFMLNTTNLNNTNCSFILNTCKEIALINFSYFYLNNVSRKN